MKVIAGRMMPLTNCAPKLAVNSSSFFSRNRCSVSRWRPKTLTRACPEKFSSMSPFSSPVFFHWATNIFCERRAITVVTRRVRGTVTRATSARSGESRSIAMITPTTVSTEVISWLSDCERLVDTLSMSFVTRLSTSPRWVESK